ncbi:hypothetical protein KASIA_p017 [Shewanella phage vB_SspS_KASIA]|nr:hypothetical protein KASIA_p017 [Shewanella phage vB_SspS_KASIA]
MNAKLVSNGQLKELYQKLVKDKYSSYVFKDNGGNCFEITFTNIGYKVYNSEPRSMVESGIKSTVSKIINDLNWIKSMLASVTAIGVSEVTLSDDECSKYARILTQLEKAGVLEQEDLL